MTLGDLIKQYRDEHGLSMDVFAEKSGISKAYISLLEKNRHPKTGNPITPSIGIIKQAADGMGMDFNKLFTMIDSTVELSPTSSVSWVDKSFLLDSESENLRNDEQELLKVYNQLNDYGKEKALEYIEDLVGNEKYTEEKSLDSEKSG